MAPSTVTAAVPTFRISLGSAAQVAAIYLVTVIGGFALARWWLPFPEIGMVRAKIEHLALHGDDYDILFLGSSRVHQQIIPAVFDRIAAAHGMPVKSFNAGIGAMVSPEDGYVLEELLRRPHRRLRWVFIEIEPLATQVWGEDTPRFGYWHDTPRLTLIARRLRADALHRALRLKKDPASTFADRCGVWITMAGQLDAHARQWLMRATSFSRGSDFLDRWVEDSGSHDDVASELGPGGDGWVPAPRRFPQMTGEARAQYLQACADRLVTPAVKDRSDAISQAALERMLAAVAKAGAQPVLLVAPVAYQRNFYPTQERERELTIMDFSNVRQYPELFTLEHRLDAAHLNTAGAEIFTDELARRFLEVFSPHSNPPRDDAR